MRQPLGAVRILPACHPDSICELWIRTTVPSASAGVSDAAPNTVVQAMTDNKSAAARMITTSDRLLDELAVSPSQFQPAHESESEQCEQEFVEAHHMTLFMQ